MDPGSGLAPAAGPSRVRSHSSVTGRPPTLTIPQSRTSRAGSISTTGSSLSPLPLSPAHASALRPHGITGSGTGARSHSPLRAVPFSARGSGSSPRSSPRSSPGPHPAPLPIAGATTGPGSGSPTMPASHANGGRSVRLRVAISGVPLDAQRPRMVSVPMHLAADMGAVMAHASRELAWADGPHGSSLAISRLFFSNGEEATQLPGSVLVDGDLVVATSGADFRPILPPEERVSRCHISRSRAAGVVFVFRNGTPFTRQEPVEVVLRPKVNLTTFLASCTRALGWDSNAVRRSQVVAIYSKNGAQLKSIAAVKPGAEIVASAGGPFNCSRE